MLYLFNGKIVIRPRLDMFLAVVTWMIVYIAYLFFAAITANPIWILFIGVFTFAAIIPYADFMRGTAWSMLVVGIYLFATIGVQIDISLAFVLISISTLEIVHKWDEMAPFEEANKHGS